MIFQKTKADCDALFVSKGRHGAGSFRYRYTEKNNDTTITTVSYTHLTLPTTPYV